MQIPTEKSRTGSSPENVRAQLSGIAIRKIALSPNIRRAECKELATRILRGICEGTYTYSDVAGNMTVADCVLAHIDSNASGSVQLSARLARKAFIIATLLTHITNGGRTTKVHHRRYGGPGAVLDSIDADVYKACAGIRTGSGTPLTFGHICEMIQEVSVHGCVRCVAGRCIFAVISRAGDHKLPNNKTCVRRREACP